MPISIPRMMLRRRWFAGALCIVVVLLYTWLFVQIFENPDGQLEMEQRTSPSDACTATMCCTR